MSLAQKVKSRKFVVLGEFQPPKGADFSPLLNSANHVKGRVDALVVPEMAQAVLKASSLGGCAFLEGHGFETVYQACTRDRNRLALQADILSAAALGVKNIMVIEGEEITLGDHIQARKVSDLDLNMLLEALQGLKAGKDMAGVDLARAPDFLVGSDLDVGVPDGRLDLEIKKLTEKIKLGAEFVITGPVFDLRRFQGFLSHLDTNRIAVIPTVLVLKSVGMARYVDRNLKNVSIPQETIKRLVKAPDRPREGLKLAGEIIARLRDAGAAGVMVATRGWEDRLPRILDEAGC